MGKEAGYREGDSRMGLELRYFRMRL